METTPKITIEELAVKLNGKMWVKGDLKRIYLDRGHNTKKMSTKTYVFEKDGQFIVSCYIDCPSQAYQWIESQQNEVKESVYSQIEEIVEELSATNVYVLFKEGSFIDYFNNNFEAGDPLYSNDVYYSEAKAKIQIKENNLLCEIKSFSKSEWVEMCSKFVPIKKVDSIEKQNTVFRSFESEIDMPIEVASLKLKELETKENTQNINVSVVKFELGEGKKVKHNRFGLGEIIEELQDGDYTKLRIVFETEGEKLLLARFANLTYL